MFFIVSSLNNCLIYSPAYGDSNWKIIVQSSLISFQTFISSNEILSGVILGILAKSQVSFINPIQSKPKTSNFTNDNPSNSFIFICEIILSLVFVLHNPNHSSTGKGDTTKPAG